MKSFRFLLQFTWINLSAIPIFAVIVLAGAYATGVPDGADNLFRTYFGCFPLLTLIILFIYSFALCTISLNLALSFGAKRRDFFLSIQGILLLYTGMSWALQAVMSAIPDRFGWASVDRWSILMSLGGLTNWRYPVICLAISCLGCLCGLIIVRSKVLGAVIVVATMLISISAAILLIIVSDADFGLWGQLPFFLTLGGTAVVVVCEAVIWRAVSRYMVR